MNSIYNQGSDYVQVTAYYALSLPEFHMKTHSHDSCEIMYVTNGKCTVLCADEEIQLSQNQFVFLDAGVPHNLEICEGQPCSVLNIEFQCKREESMVQIRSLWENSRDFTEFCKKKMSYIVSGDSRSLGYALKDLITCLQKNPGCEDYLLCLLFQRMLLELACCVNQNKKATGMYYLKKACGYIQDNLYETMKIPEIAEYTGINKSYLQLLFSRFLHCTIIEYINQKRMEQAVFLLTNSSMSIVDIAFSTGYNSRQHFSHTFEKHYHISPQKYRKLHARTLSADTGQAQYILEDGRQAKAIKLKKT